jgi:hypothetical protein
VTDWLLSEVVRESSRTRVIFLFCVPPHYSPKQRLLCILNFNIVFIYINIINILKNIGIPYFTTKNREKNVNTIQHTKKYHVN